MDAAGEHCDPAEGCITCGDVAVPVEVLEVDDRRALALCLTEAATKETVEIALVGDVSPGDRLLVHAGTAIAELGPNERTVAEVSPR